MYNDEIIAYDISASPNYMQIRRMLNRAFVKHADLRVLIMHSDQGWQYHMYDYRQTQKEKGTVLITV